MLIAQRSRHSGAGLAVAALVTVGLAGCAGVRSAKAPSRTLTARSSVALRACPGTARGLGMIAFAASGRVELADLGSCHATVLARGTAAEVRFSADGRWVAYSRLVNHRLTGPEVVSAHGGPVRSPLGAGVIAWQWAPKGELLYGITSGGALVSASPTGARRVVAAHLGTLSAGAGFGLSPDGRRAILGRSSCGPSELATINLRTGTRSVVSKEAGASFTFAGFSADSRWLLFWSAACSASLTADGGALDAIPAAGGKPAPAISHMLLDPDFLSWCDQSLIAASGPDRETQTGSALVETAPPGWRQRTIQPARALSWVSPACAPSGRLLVAAAGPDNAPVNFGLEHRSIWLLRPDGVLVRQLTTPPARGLSYEAPRFSRDGRWILFVRSRVVTVRRAALGAEFPPPISRDTIELVPAAGGRAIPVIDFTSSDFSYYDHFDWPDEIDWYQPR